MCSNEGMCDTERALKTALFSVQVLVTRSTYRIADEGVSSVISGQSKCTNCVRLHCSKMNYNFNWGIPSLTRTARSLLTSNL